MVFSKNLAALAALASFASAAPLQAETKLSKRGFNAGASNNVVVWWGNTPNVAADSLQDACKDDSVDIVILTFATAITGNKVTVLHSGPSDDTIAPQIKACQSAGKKVFMSLGGATGTISWTSADQAKQGADTVYNQFLTSSGMYKTALDGIDLDIEDGKSAFWTDFVKELASKKSKDQYIGGAPQCPSPDASLPFDVLNQMDFVWVQFYNNGPCNHGASGFMDSVKDWSKKLTKPKLYIAAPGSQASAGSGYIDAGAMAKEISEVKSSISNLGGYALWDYSTSKNNGNYQQAVKKALGGSTGGSTGGSSASAPAGSASTPAGPSKSASTPAAPTKTGGAGSGATTPVATPTKHAQSDPAGGHTVKATSTAHVTKTKFMPTGTGAPAGPTGTGSATPTGGNTGSANTQTCSAPGTIVCSTDGSSFGICDGTNAVMMAVSQGTVCQGGNIVAADSGSDATGASSAAAPAASGTDDSDDTEETDDSDDSE